ncbi:U-box domain-containing protein 32-like [Sesamum indicum]|uniref:RING-type E3 ubiquitin transferase n=1 Tax=Sesamum indicum TaxID=4182 RepID=A0A6I9UDG2_SESIN|nr:U-box domain-containing protein 32-like [Sesamum indicum]
MGPMRRGGGPLIATNDRKWAQMHLKWPNFGYEVGHNRASPVFHVVELGESFACICCSTRNSTRVHENLKPSYILLDANFETKISDFGINNLISEDENPSSFHTLGSKNDAEKIAYMDPESLENGKLTTESDVYSFGVVILRLLTARPAMSVIRDVQCAMERGKLDAVLDTSAGEWPLRQAKQLANLTLRCCEKDPMDRPDLASEIGLYLSQ